MDEEIGRLELIMELEETKRHARHIEMRLDDAEKVLARVLEGLAYAQTSGERYAALEIAEELPTMRVWLKRGEPDEEE